MDGLYTIVFVMAVIFVLVGMSVCKVFCEEDKNVIEKGEV